MFNNSKIIGGFVLLVLLPSLLMIYLYGIGDNAFSIPAICFSFSIPLLIQLVLKGSSVPFFLVKYKKWAKEKYNLSLYRKSLVLGVFLPLIFILLCVQDAFKYGPNNLGGLFAAAVITIFYFSVLLLILDIYNLIKHIKNKDTQFAFNHLQILFFITASLIIVNSMQFLLYVAVNDSVIPILEIYYQSLSNILTNNNLIYDIIILASFTIYIGLFFTVINKRYKISDYVSLNNLILMTLPLFMVHYIIINQIYLLSRFGNEGGGEKFWKVFDAFTTNTLEFSMFFIGGFSIIIVLKKLNNENKVYLEKFEFIDKSTMNKIFSALSVVILVLGLIYMQFVEGSGMPMSFLYLATVFSLIPIYFTRQNNKIDFLVQDRIKNIKEAKEKTEKILFNVLPKKVAIELNDKGNVLPKAFSEVSVLFTDFKNFTNASSTMSPDKLVTELNAIFYLFDDIIEDQGVEKIKTIGDSYMIASGVPNSEQNHAKNCIETGFKMIESLNERNKNKGIKWDMRIGIHSGSVVAGLVGKNRFTYDLWGDTVNIASRMESSSEANKINISGITYDLVKTFYEFTYRGKVDVKGKGDIDMYFVNQRVDN